MKISNKAEYVNELLQKYRADKKFISQKKIEFSGDLSGKDVYNICHEFTFKGQSYIAGRVEARDSEISSVRFFRKESCGYVMQPQELPMLQDPCVTFVDGKILLGGTEIFETDGAITNWRTVFFIGDDLGNLEKCVCAPDKMKDVRILQADGGYHVFTRPQGGIAKYGKIGYIFVKRLEDITSENISKAKLIDGLFAGDEWGGTNQIIPLSNGLLGVVGHIARMEQGFIRHYYGMVFAFNPVNFRHTPVKIICEQSDFGICQTKRPDLADVVFLGGIVRNNDGTATIYAGVCDAEAHCAVIEDPFAEYEVSQ